MMSAEEKAIVGGENDRVYINRLDQASERKPLETAGLNPSVDCDTQNLLQPEVTISYSEQQAKFVTGSISQERQERLTRLCNVTHSISPIRSIKEKINEMGSK